MAATMLSINPKHPEQILPINRAGELDCSKGSRVMQEI
jgi:hypothetical protein